MILKFILHFTYFNLAFLTFKQKEDILEKTGLTHTRVVEIFEYRKNNDGYWDGTKLH